MIDGSHPSHSSSSDDRIRRKIEALGNSLSLPTVRKALGVLEGEHASNRRGGNDDPMDIRVDPSKRTTQQLFRGFMHSLGSRTEGNDFNKGALDCALGIVNRDERYLGIYEFCVWYYKLLKKEGLIDEGPVRQS